MRAGFYLQNFDTWQAQPINKFDTGLRCRGNMQFYRVRPDSGMNVSITSQVDYKLHVNFFVPPTVTARSAYRTAWRVKRLFDRIIAMTRTDHD